MVGSLDIAIGTLARTGSQLTTRVRLVGSATAGDGATAALKGGGASANGTVITAIGLPGITNAFGEVWTITAGRQIAVNGIADATTRNVVELAYVNGLVWQLNTVGNWYSKPRASAAWSAATRTSPLPAAASLGGAGSSRDVGSAALTTAISLHGFSADFSRDFQQ